MKNKYFGYRVQGALTQSPKSKQSIQIRDMATKHNQLTRGEDGIYNFLPCRIAPRRCPPVAPLARALGVPAPASAWAPAACDWWPWSNGSSAAVTIGSSRAAPPPPPPPPLLAPPLAKPKPNQTLQHDERHQGPCRPMVKSGPFKFCDLFFCVGSTRGVGGEDPGQSQLRSSVERKKILALRTEHNTVTWLVHGCGRGGRRRLAGR